MNRPRILVADDNVEMARTTADGLTEHGYDVVIAAGGPSFGPRVSGWRDSFP